MKRTSKRVIAFFLILVLVLSLCACAQKQQAGTDEPNRSADGETLSGMPDQKLPEKLRPGVGGSDMQPTPTGFSAEAEQSLVWLRERMAFPQTMFGAAFLGYTGEASDGDWLSETDQAALQKYPFISEIDTGHIIGNDDYLYCLVPIDENATVSVNLMRWDSKSDTEEVIEVLYRSEVGDPLLIFAAGGGRCIRIPVLHTGPDRRQRRQQLRVGAAALYINGAHRAMFLGKRRLPLLRLYGIRLAGRSFRACTVAWQTAGAASMPPGLAAAGQRRQRHGIRTVSQITTCGSFPRMRWEERSNCIGNTRVPILLKRRGKRCGAVSGRPHPSWMGPVM